MRFFSAVPCALQKSDDLKRVESVLSLAQGLTNAIWRTGAKPSAGAVFVCVFFFCLSHGGPEKIPFLCEKSRGVELHRLWNNPKTHT